MVILYRVKLQDNQAHSVGILVIPRKKKMVDFQQLNYSESDIINISFYFSEDSETQTTWRISNKWIIWNAINFFSIFLKFGLILEFYKWTLIKLWALSNSYLITINKFLFMNFYVKKFITFRIIYSLEIERNFYDIAFRIGLSTELKLLCGR